MKTHVALFLLGLIAVVGLSTVEARPGATGKPATTAAPKAAGTTGAPRKAAAGSTVPPKDAKKDDDKARSGFYPRTLDYGRSVSADVIEANEARRERFIQHMLAKSAAFKQSNNNYQNYDDQYQEQESSLWK